MAQLRKMIRLIRKDINDVIVPAIRATQAEYTADSWVQTIVAALDLVIAKWSSPQFNIAANQLAQSFVQSTNTRNRESFNSDMKRIGLDVFGDSPELQSYIDASVYDNSQLIKSISSQYLERVQTIVTTNTRAGVRPSAIESLLRDQFGVTDRRAKMIARDQTAKLNGQLAERRQKNTGFEYFGWEDSDDSRVRHRHDEIANKVTAYGVGIYRWDNLPLSSEGTPISPGSDYQCRCYARPVSQREVDENVKAGRTRPGVYR